MMDIFFQDPTEIPLPPNEVRILQLRVEPWPDNRRVRIYLELTPFQKRPNGEIRILDAGGEEVASVTIVEAIDRRMEFTVHLREVPTGGEYTASATVYYAETENDFTKGDEGNTEPTSPPPPTRIIMVDRSESRFYIPA